MHSVDDALSPDAASASAALCAMLQKERRAAYRSGDYLLGPSLAPPRPAAAVTASDRARIVDWCYTVVDQLEFDRANVAAAMSMVDRFSSRPGNQTRKFLQDRERYQLLALTALYVSIKISETVVLGSAELEEMTQGFYAAGEIEETELQLLRGLSWRIYAPSSIQLSHHMLSVLRPHVTLDDSSWCTLLNETKHQVECSVRDYFLSTQRPSTVAVAAICNALDVIDRQDCQAVLFVQLSRLEEALAPPAHLQAVAYMLQLLVDGNDYVEDCPTLEDTPSEQDDASLATVYPKRDDASLGTYRKTGSEASAYDDEASPRTVQVLLPNVEI